MRRAIFIGVAAATLSAFFTFAEHASAQSPAPVQVAQTGAASMRQMTYADLERLYLDGKISAKEYQKLLADLKSRPSVAPAPARPSPPPAATAPPTKNPGAAAASPKTNQPPVAVTSTNKADTITDVEAKMDALIKARAAREKATNTPPRTVTAGPKTKRDRLNDLLRLYIEGKISETELNERRSKIIAEPD